MLCLFIMISNKISYTLGICNDETASACLFNNGVLVAAVSEERFSRKKLDKSFPIKAIGYVLKHANINLRSVENISYAWAKDFHPELKLKYDKRSADCKKISNDSFKIFSERIKWEVKSDKKKREEFQEWAKSSLTQQQLKSMTRFYHHEAHAASAALLSPFTKGLVLTSDGRGDFEALAIWLFDRNNPEPLTKVYSSTSSDSLGYFYGRITGLLGFKPMRHEGKVTGLSAHGDPSKAQSLMRKMIDVKDGELIASLGDYYRPFFAPYSEALVTEVKKFSREDIAAAAQKHLEWCLCEILSYHSKKLNLGSMPLMLGGGTFGNVKATQALKSLDCVSKVFVQPQMGDGGLCIGAAALSVHLRKLKVQPLEDVYLGPLVQIDEIDVWKNKFPNLRFDVCSSIQNKMCEDLINNRVLGLVRGRMEFGPRALCNRSIIYKTSDKNINDWLNTRLGRNEFMPFAPVIRSETAKVAFKHYFSDDLTLRFMTSTIYCSEEFAKKCPAVTHLDQTARPQIVHKDRDPFLWTLLEKWEEVSGEMALVNTSFNAHEEPIICNEREAIDALVDGLVDILYIKDIRISLVKNFE